MSVKKVLIITNVPQDYRTSLFNELNIQLAAKNIQLKVVFAAAGYKRRKQKLDFTDMKFNFEMLKSLKFNLGNIEKTMFTYSGVSKLFSSYKPDRTIVIGYSIATLRLWLLSFIKPVNYIIWSGSIDRKGQLDSRIRIWLRKQFIKRASAYIAYGSKAKEYLLNMGADASKTFIGINTVDTSYYATQTNALREKLPTSPVKHLTYIGYLSERKKVIQLLHVVKALSQKRTDFVLDLIGDGDTKQQLMDYVVNEKLENLVHFHGFLQKAQLPAFLAASDCFLFQTGFDIWGLVLNEAMAAGVACIASPHAGSTFDLIQEGQTGFSVYFENTNGAANKINYILDNPEKARIMGQKAAQFIAANASVMASVQGFIKAIEN